jgi:methionine synthase II (cobalamin-independent)
MKRSSDRILTTFAGSLIRPPEVLALTSDTDDATRTATLRAAVAEAVQKQVEIGVDIVSDGEFGKSSWFTYVMDRLGGYEMRPAERPKIGVRGNDEARYPDFWQTVGPQGGMPYRRNVCVGPIEYIGKSVMQRDVDNLLSALPGLQVEGAFLPVVAPTSISVDHSNEYYPNHAAYLEAVADALHEEYKTITDAGLIVQLDDAILTHWYDRITDEGGDYRKWVAQQVEIINHALRGIPHEQVRYHVCWGSWPGYASQRPGVFDRSGEPTSRMGMDGVAGCHATRWQDPAARRHQSRDQPRRAPGADRPTAAALRRPGWARERDRQQRLWVCAGRRDTTPGPKHRLGKTFGAHRGRAVGLGRLAA